MMDAVIQFRGTIYEGGYGLIANKVMRDKSLPKFSRLIYAYMCSFASDTDTGNGRRKAFPSVSLQCGELEITEDTYYKYRKFLIQKGLISIEKQKLLGKFDRNLYFIEPVPVEKIDEKIEEKIEEIDENLDIEPKKPYPKKTGTVEKNKKSNKKPYPNSSGTVESSTMKSGTNSTSINNTSTNKKYLKDVNKDVNISKKMLLDILNNFYTDFAVGRWSKEQWEFITNKLSEELLDDDGIFRKADHPKSYLKGCLKKIVHHHDTKSGKKSFKYQGTLIPYYDWHSQK